MNPKKMRGIEISYPERQFLELRLLGKWGLRRIAREMGRDHSVLSREVKTNRIESTWSRLKRFLRRTVGRPTCTDFDETAREFEWRVNSPEIFDSPLKFLQMFLNPVPLACS